MITTIPIHITILNFLLIILIWPHAPKLFLPSLITRNKSHQPPLISSRSICLVKAAGRYLQTLQLNCTTCDVWQFEIPYNSLLSNFLGMVKPSLLKC